MQGSEPSRQHPDETKGTEGLTFVMLESSIPG